MKCLIPVLFLLFLLFPLFVNAQTWINPFIGSPCAALTSPTPNVTKLCLLMVRITNIVYVFGISLVIVVIIIGGIMYMTAGADESKVSNAKKTLLYGLIGAAIIMLSTFIVNFLQEVIINSLIS